METLTETEAYEQYDEMLDECHQAAKIGYLEFSPSRILKELDEIAYRYGFTDWLDNETGIEVEGY